MMSFKDQFRSFIAGAAKNALTYLRSEDGKNIINNLIDTGTQIARNITTDVLEGKTPNLVELVTGGIAQFDPTNSFDAKMALEVYRTHKQLDRFQADYKTDEKADRLAMEELLANDNISAAHDKEQDLFLKMQARYDSDVASSLTTLDKDVSIMTDEEKRLFRLMKQSIVSIRDHLKEEERVTKGLATVASVRAGVDTAGSFLEMIPVLGSFIKGCTEIGTTAATVAETAIAFNGPNFVSVDSAINEMSAHLRDVVKDSNIAQLSGEIPKAKVKEIMSSTFQRSRKGVFKINRPHLSDDLINVKEPWSSRISEESMPGWHVFTRSISLSQIAIYQYMPSKDDLYHIFLIFDVDVRDICRVIVEVDGDANARNRTKFVRQNIYNQYASVRDEMVKSLGLSSIEYISDSTKDMSHVISKSDLAHICYLGSGDSGSRAMERTGNIIRHKYSLMQGRETAVFRGIVARLLIGSALLTG
jgi:hypothetical protein